VAYNGNDTFFERLVCFLLTPFKIIVGYSLLFIELEISRDLDAEEHFTNALNRDLSQSLISRKHELLEDELLKVFSIFVCAIENQSIN